MSMQKPTSSALFFLFFLQFVGVTLADGGLAPASEAWTSIFDSNDGLKVSGVVLAIIALVVGAMLAVLGYQLFHMTVFVIGFIVGGVACALVVERIFQNESWVVTISWIAFIVGGILCGFLAICLYWPAVFLVGVLAGAMLAVLINTSFAYRIAPSHPGIVLLVLAIVLGIIGGILAVKFERPVIILATSFVGAFLIMWGVGFFAGGYPSFNDLGHYRTTDSDGGSSYDLPTGWWAYLAATIGVFAVAAFIQFRFTAKAHHDRQTHRRRHRGFPFRSRAVGRQDQFANVRTPHVV